MKNYIFHINSLVNEINSLPNISEENQRKLDKKFRLEFNFNSNHIEGNTLTYNETELLLIFDKTEGIHEMREYEEMKAHDVAFKLIQEWASNEDFRLSEIHIKQLNEIILVRPFYKEAITPDGQSTRRLIEIGQYKTHPNSVRLQNGELFQYASPLETPMKMGDLMAWYHEETEKKELHPVALAALFHYNFVLIHPFDDGNGRISRLIMNYVLLKNNLPPIIIKTIEKKNYLNALNQADTGNLEAFVEFIASQLAWSLDKKKKAIKGESLDEPGDLDKKLYLLKKKLNEDDKVTLKYSIETIINTLEKSILPLLKVWESKLQEFDVFFNSRNNSILFDKVGISGDNLINVFNEIYTSSYPEIGFKKDIKLIKSVSLAVTFRGLRKKQTNGTYNGGSVSVAFFENAFEITCLNGRNIINKLYSQILSDNEIESIVSFLGNWLYDTIENEIEK